jgi:hypothetical protein
LSTAAVKPVLIENGDRRDFAATEERPERKVFLIGYQKWMSGE